MKSNNVRSAGGAGYFGRSVGISLAAACFVVSGSALAGEITDAPRFSKAKDYTSAKDWNLKAEN